MKIKKLLTAGLVAVMLMGIFSLHAYAGVTNPTSDNGWYHINLKETMRTLHCKFMG